MKVFVVGGDYLVAKMFEKNGHTLVPGPEDAELLCFTGGADVNPVYYKDVKHRTTRYDDNRDRYEIALYNLYSGLPKVGICRGSQFLNVMSGGTLWQDVDGHAIGITHSVTYLIEGKYDYNFDPDDDDNPNRKLKNEDWMVTSTHHQMMRPDKKTAELWGYAYEARYRDTGSQEKRRTNLKDSPDVEIVFYEHSKSLCFQPHPEYGVKSCEDLFFTCLDRALNRLNAAPVAA